MVQQGNLAGASALAKAPGVLKPSAAGSQLRHLGTGSEGVATLVAHPEHGVSVRKLYDPRGLATPEMIRRKEEVGRAVGPNPNMAQFYGSAQTPQGGGTMHFSEFVSPQGPHAEPGQSRRTQGPLTQNQAAQQTDRADAVEKTRQQTVKAVAGTRRGYSGAMDVRDANMIWDGQSGRFKTVDYMPVRRGEFYQNSTRRPQAYRNVTSPGDSFDGNTVAQLHGRDPRSNFIPTSSGTRLLQNPSKGVDSTNLTRTMLGKPAIGTGAVGAPDPNATSVLQPPAAMAASSGKPRPMAQGSQATSVLKPRLPKPPMTQIQKPPLPQVQMPTAVLGRK